MALVSQASFNDIFDAQGKTASELIREILEAPQEGTFFHLHQQSAKMAANMRYLDLKMHKDRRRCLSGSSFNNMKEAENIASRFTMEKVTLAFEMCHTDHAEFQTNRLKLKLDDSLSKIIAETKTNIIFPDQEDLQQRDFGKSDQTQFCNQILVHGTLRNVNEARRRLRKLTPIKISFGTNDSKGNMSTAGIKCIVEKMREEGLLSSVDIQIIPHFQYSDDAPKENGGPTVHVSGRISHCEHLIKACDYLKTAIFDEEAQKKVSFSSYLEVPTCQWSILVGEKVSTYALIVMVSRKTKAEIHFPEKIDRNMASFFCTANDPAAVIQARAALQSLVPIQLSLDVSDDELRYPLAPDQREGQVFDAPNQVTINVSKSAYELEPLVPGESMKHFVHFVTEEMNIAGLYTAFFGTFNSSRFINDCLDTSDYDILRSHFLVACKEYVKHMQFIKTAAAPLALLNQELKHRSDPTIRPYHSNSITEPEMNRHLSVEYAKNLLQRGLLTTLPGFPNNTNYYRTPIINSYQNQDDFNNSHNTSSNASYSSVRSQYRSKTGTQYRSGENQGRRSNLYSYTSSQDRSSHKGSSTLGSSRRGNSYHNRYDTRPSIASYGNNQSKHYCTDFNSKSNWRNDSQVPRQNDSQPQIDEHAYHRKRESFQNQKDDYQFDQKDEEDRSYKESTPQSGERSSRKISLQLRDSKKVSTFDMDLSTTSRMEPLELIRVASTEPQSMEHSREIAEYCSFENGGNCTNMIDPNHRSNGVATYAQILEGKKP